MEDLAAIARDLDRAASRAEREVSQSLLRTGDRIKDAGKQNVPTASYKTQESIDVFATGDSRKARPGDLDIEVGPTTWYAHFPERGNSRHAGVAYMGRAFDSNIEGGLKNLFDVAADDLLW